MISIDFTTWKVFKYGVISGPYFPVFRLNTEIYIIFNPNTGKYGPEIFLYLDTIRAVIFTSVLSHIFNFSFSLIISLIPILLACYISSSCLCRFFKFFFPFPFCVRYFFSSLLPSINSSWIISSSVIAFHIILPLILSYFHANKTIFLCCFFSNLFLKVFKNIIINKKCQTNNCSRYLNRHNNTISQ